MSKLELWEFLHENTGWHSSIDLRKQFKIGQQVTLKNWTNVPFIMSYTSNKGKMYRFNNSFAEEYDKAIEEQVYVPPIKLKNGKEVQADIPESEPEYFTIKFPILKSEVGKVADREMHNIAKLGPEWNWVKQAIVSADSIKYRSVAPMPKQVIETLIVSLSAIIGYNGVNFEGVDAIKKALFNPPVGESIEDIRQAELQDIMKHVPKPKEDEIDPNWFFDSTT